MSFKFLPRLYKYLLNLIFPYIDIDSNLDIVVISAQNLRLAGGLSVLLQFISELPECRSKFQLICFVHSKDLIDPNLFGDIPFLIIELPFSSKSWIVRLFYEYFAFYIFSLVLRVKLWIALHDLTPLVRAERRLLLYHNALLFWSPPLLELFSSFPVLIAWFSYKLFVPINLKSNDFIAVQAPWIREELGKLYSLELNRFSVISNRVTSEPADSIQAATFTTPIISNSNSPSHSYAYSSLRLLYPCFPRPFKNLYRLMTVVSDLTQKGFNITLMLTFDPTTNLLARRLSRSFTNPCFKYLGYLPKDELLSTYDSSDCLIFPSTLETLGLPLLEFANYANKPILASNLPYAISSLRYYGKKSFFDPYDVFSISSSITDLLLGRLDLSSSLGPSSISPPDDESISWSKLIDSLLSTTF